MGSSKKTGGKKPKEWDAELNGVKMRLHVCPHRRRLCVVKNPGERKGYLLLRCEDGMLVAWARLKGHASDAMEELEESLDHRKMLDNENYIIKLRRALAEM